jgi:hypothetical protein
MTVDYRDNQGNLFSHDSMKDCPFCGGVPKIKFVGNNRTPSRSVEIQCTGCRVKRKDASINHSQEWVAKACIDYWNNRANEKQPIKDKIRKRKQ